MAKIIIFISINVIVRAYQDRIYIIPVARSGMRCRISSQVNAQAALVGIPGAL